MMSNTEFASKVSLSKRVVVCFSMFFSFGACHHADGPEQSATAAPHTQSAATEPNEGVTLTPEEVVKMGVITTEVALMNHVAETTGFATVMSHETIAQALAEWITAAAVERQSQAAYARGQRLAGTAGALPADSQEAAERQAIVDHAALELATRRLTSTFGQDPPWGTRADSAELRALANGADKLVRITFPIGQISGANPSSLRLGHLNAKPGAKSWITKQLWSAPADSSIPGRSLFALLKGSDAGEGERLLAWAPVGNAQSGVQIPAAAVIINGGKYWYYVETKPDEFVRKEMAVDMPTADGYFVTEGISAGDKVVTASAGALLAREINPSTEAE